MATPATAQLTATVQPGYVFSPSEAPTTTTLNQLGQPTITISGTLSGTAGIAANSVTGDQMSDGFPDGVTLNYNGSSPRQIQIKNAGVNTNQLSPYIVGPGLTGAAGLPLAVLPDNATIKTNANKVTVGTIGPTNVAYGPITGNFTNTIVDCSSNFTFALTLTNQTWITITNIQNGQTLVLSLTQDGTGSRVANWQGQTFKWRSAGGAPTLTTTANHTDIFTFLRVGSVVYGNWSLNYN